MNRPPSSGGAGLAALFIVWACLTSLQFIVLGDGSFIRVHDNADSNHPNIYAAEHNPALSPDHSWNHFAVCGYPRFYHGGFYGFLQRIFPGWSGYALLMVCQRFIAGYFMFLLARVVLGFTLPASLAAGLWYPFLVTLDPLGIYHSLGEPALPLYLVLLDFLMLRCPLLLRLAGGALLGAFFGFGASLYIAQPYLLVGMLFFLLVVRRYRFKFLLSVGLGFAAGMMAVDLPAFLATWGIKDWTQRLLVGKEWQPAAADAGQKFIFSLSNLVKDNLIPLTLMLVGVFYGLLRQRFARWLLAALVLCGGVAYLLPMWLVSATGWQFFRAFQVDRFYILVPFFLTLAVAYSLMHTLGVMKAGRESWSMKLGALGNIALLSLAVMASFYLIGRRYQIYAGRALGDVGTMVTAALGLGVVLMTLAGLATRVTRGSWTKSLGWYLAMTVPIASALTFADRLTGNLLSAEKYRELYLRPEYQTVRAEWQPEAPFRVATLYPDNTRSDQIYAERPLHPSFAAVANLETADGYMPLYPARYHLFWRRVIQPVRERQPKIRSYFDSWGQRVYLFADDYFSRKRAPTTGDEFKLRLLGLANVQYLFSRREVSREGLTKVHDGAAGGLFVYRNESCLPRFFIAHRTLLFEDSTALLDSLANADMANLRNTAFLESAPALDTSDVSSGGGDTVMVRRYESDRIELEVQAAGAGVLMVTNNWFPGWKAMVNGLDSPVMPADFTFQGVAVPGGRSEIVLYYNHEK